MAKINVNNKDYEVDVPDDVPLLWVLRDHLELTGTKYGCGIGECGSCTVLVDGKPIRSCVTSLGEVKGKKIVTIEGVPSDHPVKKAWVLEQVPQCGFCQPGIIMEIIGILQSKRDVRAEAVMASLDNVICRCGTYPRIKKGILKAIELMNKGG